MVGLQNTDKSLRLSGHELEEFPWIFRFILRHPMKGVIFWLIAAVVCAPLTMKTLKSTTMKLNAARNSPSGMAYDMLSEDFPGMSDEFSEAVMINCRSCKVVTTDPFVLEALHVLSAKCETLNTMRPGYLVSWDSPEAAADSVAQGRRLAEVLRIKPPRSPFLSTDGRGVLFRTKWRVHKDQEPKAFRMVKEMVTLVNELNRQGGKTGHTVTISGTLSMAVATIDTLKKEMFMKEGLVTPLALVAFLIQVRSWRLTVLCAITMVIGELVSLGSMYLGTMWVKYPVACPSLASATALALSLDYSLFLLTRWKEEVECGQPAQAALCRSVLHSGGVVGLSGTILAVSFLVCLWFPGDFVWSLGMAGAWATVSVLVINLTFIPCVLLLIGDSLAGSFRQEGEASTAVKRCSMLWFKWGSFITKGWRPVAVTLLIYACMAPVIWTITKYEPSQSLEYQIPVGSFAASGYKQMMSAFPIGTIEPLWLLRRSQHGNLMNDQSFQEACEVLNRLVSVTSGTSFSLQARDFQSVFAVPGPLSDLLPPTCPKLVCLRWSRTPPECPIVPSAKNLLYGSGSNLTMPGLDLVYQRLWAETVNARNTSAITIITAEFEQFGPIGKPFTHALRTSVADAIVSYAMSVMEVSSMVYRRMPLVIGMNVVFMSLLIGLGFGTALAPIKMFLTILVPVAFVYGVTVCVFQLGALRWLHLVQFNGSGIFFMVPMVSVSLLIGLAMDYDVFLFTRILELRKLGFDNRAAVVGGLAMTGPVITIAGVIMALAFMAMLLSEMPVNCQIGFVICAGVLIDTFIIRSALVPAMLCLMSTLNYWPLKLPPADRSLEDMEQWLTSALPRSKA